MTSKFLCLSSTRVTVLLMVLAAVCPLVWAGSGAVLVAGDVVRWGQYRNIKGIVSVAAPGESSGKDLPNRIKHYPVRGASSVMCRCQLPGRRFFSEDGKGIDPAALEAVRRDVAAVYAFDMLPIIVLFDPDPSCRLESGDAYANAALTLIDVLEKDFWFLLCISDRCGKMGTATHYSGAEDTDQPKPPGHGENNGLPSPFVELALDVADAVKEKYPRQVIAAGGSANATNDKLLAGDSPIDVIMARVDALGSLECEGTPLIEVVDGASLTADIIAAALQKTFGEFSYGFAVHFDNAADDCRARMAFLDKMHQLVDTYEKTQYPASPIDPDDTCSLKPGEAEEGFKSLFNGKDLSGWVQLTDPGNFVVRDGVIELEQKSGGWLRSWDAYGDFVFRAEYKIEDGGNSGIFVRTAPYGRTSRIGFEFQIRGQPADAQLDKNGSGAIYDVRPPDGNFMKPGQWNEVEITCTGLRVKIVWNGRVVHDFSYADIDFMKNRSQWGYLGLQDHHDFVQFRNLRIKPLD